MPTMPTNEDPPRRHAPPPSPADERPATAAPEVPPAPDDPPVTAATLVEEAALVADDADVPRRPAEDRAKTAITDEEPLPDVPAAPDDAFPLHADEDGTPPGQPPVIGTEDPAAEPGAGAPAAAGPDASPEPEPLPEPDVEPVSVVHEVAPARLPEPGPERVVVEDDVAAYERVPVSPPETDDRMTGPERFVARWEDIQAAFVDQPRGAVQDADQLVVEVIDEIVAELSRERNEVAAGWRDDPDVSTEDLRQAFRSYRTVFGRLVRTAPGRAAH